MKNTDESSSIKVNDRNSILMMTLAAEMMTMAVEVFTLLPEESRSKLKKKEKNSRLYRNKNRIENLLKFETENIKLNKSLETLKQELHECQKTALEDSITEHQEVTEALKEIPGKHQNRKQIAQTNTVSVETEETSGNETDSDVFEKESKADVNTCGECGRKFSSHRNRNNHLKAAHNKEEPFHCNEKNCGKIYFKALDLKRHRQEVHMKEGFKCTCNDCDKIFKSKYARDRHVRNDHEKEGRVKCQECGKIFFDRNGLKGHMRAVHDEPLLKCGIDGCTATFVTQSGRWKHRTTAHLSEEE